MEYTHCPACGCHIDDHSNDEDVDDGIPWQRVGAGVSEPDDIIDCGDCADCRIENRELESLRPIIEALD